MAITIVATPGASNANSYLTPEEDLAYQEVRLHSSGWVVSGEQQKAALVMATRLIDAHFSRANDEYDRARGKKYVRAWTGAASSEAQALCWPRTGMYSRNGYALASGLIPAALKEAVSEFAHQLVLTDRTLDNDVITQGITSLKAGSVALSFKDSFEAQVVPDAVIALLVPSWYATVVYTNSVFEVL